MPKNVLIAESNRFFLETLAGTLSVCGYRVVGTTSNGSDVVDLALKTKPQVLIFDFNLLPDGMAGLPELKRLKNQHPQMKILVLGFQETSDEFVAKLQSAGLDGFWNKFDDAAVFFETLNRLSS